MVTSTAALQFYHLDFLQLGVWTWVSTLDGCSCGTEGAKHRNTFYVMTNPGGWLSLYYYSYMSFSKYPEIFDPYQRLMSAALVFLILIALTNYIMIFFSCHGLHIYGAWLNKYHKLDLWLHRVLVRKEIDGLVGQIKWGDCLHLPSAGSEWYRHIRDMDNHCIAGQSEHRADQRRKNGAGRRRHCFVLYFDCRAVFVVSAMQRIEIQQLRCYFVDLRCWHSCRFILENSVLDEHVRYILSIYPAMIWALTGVLTKNYDTADPSRNNIFNGEKQINNKQLPFSLVASVVLVFFPLQLRCWPLAAPCLLDA